MQSNTGSALITVLVLTTILLTIASGTAYLHQVNSRLAKNSFHEAQALYLAEGGLAAAETILLQHPRHRESLAGNLTTGTYKAVFGTNQEKLEGQQLTLPVEATGRAGLAKQTLVEFFTLEPYPRHKAYDYVLFHASEQVALSLAPNMSIQGDVFANGDVSISAGIRIEGEIYTGGSIWWEEEENYGIASVDLLDFPNLDLNFYRSIATTYLSASTHVNGDENRGVVFVSGDATVTGRVLPGTAVIASGKLTVCSGVTSSGMVLLIGGEGIEVESTDSLTAALFSPATITFLKPAQIAGTVTAREVICHSGTQLCYLDPDGDSLQAQLPGLTITRSSWYQKFFVPITD